MDFSKQQREMIRVIEEEAAYATAYTGKATIDSRVLQAMATVPRHEFVPKAMQCFAYENGPLYIGHGQTISQPYIVALMTDLLMPQPEHRILDVGTGSGYQAAVLSLLVKQVYSVEIVESLAASAEQRLLHLGYHNVQVKNGDGTQGWEAHSPYDGIVVAAATPITPLQLIAQLKPGGKLVLPLGLANRTQELVVIEKQADGEFHQRYILPVAFVPLVNEQHMSHDLS